MPARGGRRARRSQAERTALSDKRMLEAAVALITQHGCHKTTLQAIGQAFTQIGIRDLRHARPRQ